MVERRALDRGKKLLAKPDYARALLQFKNAIQAMPQEAEPYYEAGLATLGERDPVAAFEYFNRAAELDPNHTDARVKAAELMAMSSDLTQVAEAEKLLTGLLPSSASNLELLGSLALAEGQLNKPDEAARYLQQALDKTPGHLASSIALAKVKLSQKDPAGAELVLKRAVEQDSQAAAPRLALAGFYLQVKRTAEAEAQIRRALDIDPQSGPALLGLATIQAQTEELQRPSKAIAGFRRFRTNSTSLYTRCSCSRRETPKRRFRNSKGWRRRTPAAMPAVSWLRHMYRPAESTRLERCSRRRSARILKM